MSFATDFRDYAIPRLTPITVHAAKLVAEDIWEFSHAVSEIMSLARKYGVTYLPHETLLEFEDWVLSSLTREIDAQETLAEKIEAGINAEIFSDPVGHYSRLAETSKNPKRMELIFSVVSPQYRAARLAEIRLSKIT